MSDKYIVPKLGVKAFTCPLCGYLSSQDWELLASSVRYSLPTLLRQIQNKEEDESEMLGYVESSIVVGKEEEKAYISRCQGCENTCLWVGKNMVYPNTNPALQPNDDLPEEVKKIYREAALVQFYSQRATAALLRLALQQLCVQLGAKGSNLLDDIKYLQGEKGLSSEWVKRMDIVRIIGNAATHPGSMNIDDDTEKVNALFGIINRIAEKLITDPKKDEEIYASLPDSKKIDTIQQQREAKKGQNK